jgi:cellulose synthase/poly-beta-1,6-N-acetylglucosamine synthase-like glycosyltransferase
VILLEILLGTAAAAVLLPTFVLFTEIVLAVTQGPVTARVQGDRRRIAVLIPAHDESTMIASTLRSILPQLSGADRLIVVADNCSDDTAAIAASEGAEVIERSDAARRGKGYALDFGVRHLASNPPDVVLIVDADCQVSRGSIDLLARLCARTDRPVQAAYLMHAGNDAEPNMRLAEFAWLVKNRVRPGGLQRLGLPCQLMGTGMAFPWQSLDAATLATGHIVEDLKLGLDLARAGTPPLFCPEALVTSNFPASAQGVLTQRTRWEHGHLSVLLSEVPSLLRDSLKSRDSDLLAMALDLCVPPLALLVLVVGVLWTVCVIDYFFTRAILPLVFTTIAAGQIATSVLLSWTAYGRQTISLGDLLLGFAYPLRKIPLYLRFVVAREMDWVRSKRDGDRD